MFIRVFFELRYQNVTWNLIQIGVLNPEISYSNLPQVISRVFQSYRIAFRLVLWLDFEQLSSYLFVYRRVLELRYENVTWKLIQIGGFNQEISYSNLPQVISRVYQVI